MADYLEDDSVVTHDENNDLMKISELNVEAQTIIISLYNLRVAIKNIESNVRHYERESLKFIRHLRKNQKGKTVRKVEEKTDRQPSGFAKKSKVRRELVEFFKFPDVILIVDKIMQEEEEKEDSKFEMIDDEDMINRPSATKIINRYIKDKGLQNASNRQFFVPDDKLKRILSPLETLDKKSGGYRCFNLQKYIKHLFL